MQIPKYWAQSVQVVRDPRGKPFRLVAWGWSDADVSQAQASATARVQQIAARLAGGGTLERYSYGERPLREETTQSVADSAGREVAVVTRNRYGALVLNAIHTLIMDIDFGKADSPNQLKGQIRWLLRGGNAPNPEDPYLERLAQWATGHPTLGLRVYRTFGGLRALVTNEVFDPGVAETLNLLQTVGSDPLYVRLCQAQGCFRARLTPKPWRCDVPLPPGGYPWQNSAAEALSREWEQRYAQIIPHYAVCRFVKQLGPATVHPEVEPVLNLHDQLTGVSVQRPLA